MSFARALSRLIATDAANSPAGRTRARRFEDFERLFDRIASEQDRPVTLLDVGGTNAFWEQRGWANREGVQITITNLKPEPARHANIASRVMDATCLKEFPDGSFDIVFSNSVIEHLRTLEAQAAMASEVRRLADAYWIQTPNFWFPIEPHFLTPGWHWLPLSSRVALLRRRGWGWYDATPDPEAARALIEEVRLLRRREMQALFPDGRLLEERWCGLVKSFVAVRMEPPASAPPP